jgi:ABC-type multidrug transport system fused ATPase/permease subunit
MMHSSGDSLAEGRVNEESLGGYDRQVVARLAGYARPYSRQLALALVAMVLSTTGFSVVPWLTKWAIDSKIVTGDVAGLDLVLGAFLLAALANGGLFVVVFRMTVYVNLQVLYALRMGLFRHLQTLSMAYFDRNETGKVMSRVQNDVQQLQGAVVLVTSSMAISMIVVGSVVGMVALSWRLSLIGLTVMAVLAGTLLVWQRYATKAFRKVREAIAAVNTHLEETISGMRVVQSFNREDDSYRRFASANRRHLDANLEARTYTAILTPVVQVLVGLGIAAVLIIGGGMVIDGSLKVGVLVGFVMYMNNLFWPIHMLTMNYSQIQKAMTSGGRIVEMLNQRPEVTDAPDAVPLPPVRGEIRFEGVGFQYEKGAPVLQDFDLHVRPGETVALVGPTGAGKTTAVSMLQRLYDTTEGRVSIDGHDVREITQRSLVGQMAVVPQEPYLFTGTVADNIRFGNDSVTDEQVEQVARAVGAHEFITALENGYATSVRERGGNLSLGQRQLISFARALAADPRILVLDEATSSIESLTEVKIQQALKILLRVRTSFIIAHRLSTVRNADLIVVIDGGRIVEQGAHGQLMANGGLYARLQSYAADGAAAAALERRPPSRAGED